MSQPAAEAPRCHQDAPAEPEAPPGAPDPAKAPPAPVAAEGAPKPAQPHPYVYDLGIDVREVLGACIRLADRGVIDRSGPHLASVSLRRPG